MIDFQETARTSIDADTEGVVGHEGGKVCLRIQRQDGTGVTYRMTPGTANVLAAVIDAAREYAVKRP